MKIKYNNFYKIFTFYIYKEHVDYKHGSTRVQLGDKLGAVYKEISTFDLSTVQVSPTTNGF